MQKIISTTMTALLAVFASIMMTMTASAHSGHDHAANESMLMHVLFYGAIVTAIVASVWFAYTQFSKQK